MQYSIIGVHDVAGVDRGWLKMECAKRCAVPIRPGEPKQQGASYVWGWDGNTAEPTVLPSINCSACGFHKTLIKGKWT